MSSSSVQDIPPKDDAKTSEELYQKFTNLVSSWTCSPAALTRHHLYRHESGWYSPLAPMVSTMVADACFDARPSDVMVATLPKAGTTWMKAMMYSTVHRREHLADSSGHPLNMEDLESLSIEAAVDFFCDGMSLFGPYWDHVLGYWHAHLAQPKKVLFFRYEEMSRDPAAHVRKLAAFLGRPFNMEEEEAGMVEAIVRLCSFEHMTGLGATKYGKTKVVFGEVDNSWFFRRGQVGDWENHLSMEMARRIDAITETRFRDVGLHV